MEKETYRWSYNYSLTQNHDWIIRYCCVAFIAIAVIFLALLFANSGDFIATFKKDFWVIWMILGIFALAVVISFIYYRKGYAYYYTLKNGNLQICKNYLPDTDETIVNGKMGSFFALRDVKHIKYNKKKHYISFGGFLISSTVYAENDEIDHVYSLIKKECINLKSEKIL